MQWQSKRRKSGHFAGRKARPLKEGNGARWAA